MVFDINNRHHKRESYVINNFPKLYNNVLRFSNNNKMLFIQKLYNYINNITEIPKCKTCNKNEVSFINFSMGYLQFCSTKCVANNCDIKKNKVKTTLMRYGVDNVLKSPIIQNKIKKTNLILYNETNPSKNINIINKIKNKKILIEINNWKNKLNNQNIVLKYLNNDNIKISNYCNIHKSFIIKRQTLYGRLFRQQMENICTKCNPINENISNIEIEIKNSIKNFYNGKIIKHILSGKEIDIYLPDNKLGIEFNGLYYHSNLFKDKNYHLNKTELCEKNNIQLLHVFEDEWIYKKEIVKSIIKSKLGLIENKIFGRKTEIKEINNNKLIREFLEINHIQGFVGSKYKIGLFYENELVSIMTFGKKRIFMGNKVNIEGEYEMLRFCNKLNTTIIGGASKLLKYFIKNYQPKSIISFADRRYSQGKLYEKLGFKFIGNTRPNYWYFHVNKTQKKYHRFKFRKNILVKEGYASDKTEKEIMTERKYLRIYDSGNNKYELK